MAKEKKTSPKTQPSDRASSSEYLEHAAGPPPPKATVAIKGLRHLPLRPKRSKSCDLRSFKGKEVDWDRAVAYDKEVDVSSIIAAIRRAVSVKC